jgi:hypothetical protein
VLVNTQQPIYFKKAKINISTFIIDVFLLLIFLYGWAKAKGRSSYCGNGWRFIRAVFTPVTISIVWHCMVFFGWSENPMVAGAAVIVALMGVGPAIVLLPDFISAQLTSDYWNTKPKVAEPRGLESYLNSTKEQEEDG